MVRRKYYFILHILILSVWSLQCKAQCNTCDDCNFKYALKTNLLHDALLTPDVGIEVNIGKRFSLSAEGVWAWWSKSDKNRFWRIAGGWGEFRYWFGSRINQRSLSGHHAGIYGSFHKYDFEFGGKGWQSDGMTYGVGISYGYSFPLNKRLNLDLSARAGLTSGPYISYRKQCGVYMATSYSRRHYVGLTGLEVTLVWFPGSGDKNNPNFRDEIPYEN